MAKCLFCGSEVKASFRRSPKYCSRECCIKFNSRKNARNRECKICGKALEGKQKLYCGDECRRKGKAIWEMNYHMAYKKPEEHKEHTQKKPKQSLGDINALARAEGLNYG